MKIIFTIVCILFLSVTYKAQSVIISESNSAVTNDVKRAKYVSIYPNPSAEVLVIKVNEPKTGMEFILYNQQGQAVDKLLIIEKETQYLRRNLAKGIYTFSVLNNKEVVETGKLVFE